MSNILKFLWLAWFALLMFSVLNSNAQSFMTGYRYRKKITFKKELIEPALATVGYQKDFIVLVQLEDPALKYLPDAFENKLTSPQGLDISFAAVESTTIPLSFQLENYDPATGKLLCWVLIPKLVAKTSIDGATSIYFYYGSSKMHNPDDPAVKGMWNPAYHTIQHFNLGAPGVIVSGKAFNGISDHKIVDPHNDKLFSFSAWIKLDKVGQEQMIITNDSLGFGGYQLKINKDNHLQLKVADTKSSLLVTGITALNVNEWYFVSLGIADNALLFLLNGKPESTVGGSKFAVGSPGHVMIGVSKEGDKFFNGIIDELRIVNILQLLPWVTTEYVSQKNPLNFYVPGLEEVNNNLEPASYTFISTGSTTWDIGRNWSTGRVPGTNQNIRIKAGTTVIINTSLQLNNLLLEAGAKIMLNNDLKVAGSTELENGAEVSSTAKTVLQLQGAVLNNGVINLTGIESKLIFSGSNLVTNYSGNGQAIVQLLEIDRPMPASNFTLRAPLQVKTSLKISAGALNANGNLVLLSNNGKTAALLPVLNNASIHGNVQVQSMVDGSFSSPSSGRGWRLMSSPVIQSSTAGEFQYQVQAIQKSIYVTGKAGTANGFDVSPNNGATIYTHDQSLAGTLAQKYIPIPNMQAQIPIGKGFFMYSRGSRLLPNAYQTQIQSPPFVNPPAYVITYTGALFTGNLLVKVSNNDRGGEGDGFNLLGNPYAASIRWGSLVKDKVSDFIWLFNPLNNTYIVSEDLNTTIPAGAGFFVRMNQGFKDGSVIFNEQSKVL
jgi:hypothetical protein